ncbi:hypothetical protein ABIC47_000776 [Leifsonia sp. 563]|uniref:hypothetical protein n=1 Tax=Leifsonia sp. 563 TaxID=3156412 RepID=UPI00339B0B1B
MSDEPTFDPRRKAAIRELVVDNAAAHPGRAGGRKRTALVATLVVLALTISGGSVAYALGTGLIDLTPAAAPSPTPTVTPTPTPTPTPTSTPIPAVPVQDPADPSTWVIGFDGVGPFKLEAPFDAQRAVAPTLKDVTEQICSASYLDLEATSDLVVRIAGSQDGGQRTAAIVLGISQPQLPQSQADSPKTSSGIGLGSTLDELEAAYPALTNTITVRGLPQYAITNGHGSWIVFSIAGGMVVDIQIADAADLPVENESVQTIPYERCPA